MAESTDKSRLQRIVELFDRHGVEFLVIGGQAETLFGSPRITFDVDLCYRRTAENLRRLAAALRELGVTLRAAPPGLPFVIDERSLALGSNFTFSTPLGDLDLLAWVEPHGSYETLVSRAERYAVGGGEVKTISLDDLIRVKEHIRRPKDRQSLFQLKAIKQIRGERSAPERPGAP
jgi:predicted nucleotidyltransferase